MWPDAPGGWVYEWSGLAARYAGEGSHQLAALAYGWAKFPTLADDFKRGAMHKTSWSSICLPHRISGGLPAARP